MHPLPDLRSGDFRGGRIFHQKIYGHAAGAGKPRRQVLNPHADVVAKPLLCDGTVRQLQQVIFGHPDILAQFVNLVGVGHILIEFLHGQAHQARMGHPGAVMAVIGLADLILPDLLNRRLIGFRIVFSGDLRGHAADGMNPPAMAGMNGQQGIGMHAVPGHGDLGPIREQVFGDIFKPLDKAEDIIPSAAV